MRLLFFIGTLTTGGAERQTALLAQSLDRRGHEITVVTVYPGGQNWDWLQGRLHESKLISLFSGRPSSKVVTVFQLFLASFKLRAVIFRRKPVVIYSMLYLTNFIAWLATRFQAEVKLIWGIRTSGKSLTLKQAVPFNLCRLVSSTVPLLIANSSFGLEYHKRKGFKGKKNHIISNGIDVDCYKPDSVARKKVRDELKISEKEYLVGLVGRIIPVKGYDVFLKAAAILVKRIKDVKFVCVGSGSLEAQEKLNNLLLSLGLAERVICVGERNDMPVVYNALDVLCCASYEEGFCNVIGEAMATGIPCVVTNVGDSARIVGKTGIVVPSGREKKMADGLYEMILEGEPGTHKKQSRERIMQKFSVDKMVETTEEILLNL